MQPRFTRVGIKINPVGTLEILVKSFFRDGTVHTSIIAEDG